jgi:hypothetical protein
VPTRGRWAQDRHARRLPQDMGPSRLHGGQGEESAEQVVRDPARHRSVGVPCNPRGLPGMALARKVWPLKLSWPQVPSDGGDGERVAID